MTITRNDDPQLMTLARQASGCWRAEDRLQPLPPPLTRRPHLVVVVDTEEEFDWSHPGDPRACSVDAVAALPDLQELCAASGIVPTYVLTWPVLASDRAMSLLEPWWRQGEAEFGLHLHAWVTPPFGEPSGETFQANLSPDLEWAKLAQMRDGFLARFGVRPRVHKAGRYGIGRQTLGALVDLGIEIDTSLSPPFDYAALGGPDFRATGSWPAWLVPGRLLSIPTTGGYIGPLAGLGQGRAAVDPLLRRLRLCRRQRLSPEGASFAALRALTLGLLALGVRDFTLSLHSPSLEPGRTPYVRDMADRRALLATCRQYFAWFRDRLDGCFARLSDVAAAYRTADGR